MRIIRDFFNFKYLFFSIIFIPLIVLVLSTNLYRPKVEKNEQLILAKNLVYSLNSAFIETKKQVELFAKIIQTEFHIYQKCELPLENNTSSSIYYPKSAIRQHRTDCFVLASKRLEPLWNKFYQEAGYISWIYVYDSDSKVKRIMPASNIHSLFGENLIFDSFQFYKEAVKGYPNIAMTKVREDTNGTGKITVITKGIKLPSSKKFASMSADVRINQILKNKYQEIQNFLEKNTLTHFFIYIYSKEGSERFATTDFSNDLTSWTSIKPRDNRILNVSPTEEAQLNALENEANANPLIIKSTNITLQNKKYYCSQGRTSEIPIFILLCSYK